MAAQKFVNHPRDQVHHAGKVTLKMYSLPIASLAIFFNSRRTPAILSHFICALLSVFCRDSFRSTVDVFQLHSGTLRAIRFR